MRGDELSLTHVAGTFLIQADGSFLNGAGLGEGEYRNVTIPKTFKEGRGEVPYVSAQAWKRWLRVTAIEEAGWCASEPRAIGWNPKGKVNKIAGQLNPVEFPEDDIFGYMRAQEGQGRVRAVEDAGEGEEEESGGTTKAVMRASPFAASLLVSLRSTGWQGEDEGFVHLTRYDPSALAGAEVERFLGAVSEKTQDKKKDVWKRLEEFGGDWVGQVKSATEALDLTRLRDLLSTKAGEKKKEIAFIETPTSPLPYTTRFYNADLQAVFCLDYGRLGVFWNLGDRIELEETKVKRFLHENKIEDVTSKAPYASLSENGKIGRVYRIADASSVRKQRAAALLKALAVLRGGAKQAQFGTDVAPKVLILAGLSCGNPIFNHLFKEGVEGPELKIETLKELIRDYADRIVTPVFVGIRAGYLKNEEAVGALSGRYQVEGGGEGCKLTRLAEGSEQGSRKGPVVEVKVVTPLEAARNVGELLP